MSITIPTTDIDPRVYVKGAGRLYVADYVASGGDPGTLTFLGATMGGIEVNMAATYHDVEADQYLGPVASFRIKEENTFSASFWQFNLANIYQLIGTADLVLSGGNVGDATSSLTIGEQKTSLYRQFVWVGMAPPGATTGQRVMQFWKCQMMSAGAIKHDKTKEDELKVTWKAFTDVTAIAAGKAAVGNWLDS